MNINMIILNISTPNPATKIMHYDQFGFSSGIKVCLNTGNNECNLLHKHSYDKICQKLGTENCFN